MDERLKAELFIAIHVVVPDVRRICQNEAGGGRAVITDDHPGKVAAHHVQAGAAPEGFGGGGKGGIEFDASGMFQTIAAKHGRGGGIEAARTNRWIGEAWARVVRLEQGLHVASDLKRQWVGRGELAEAIPLFRRLQ